MVVASEGQTVAISHTFHSDVGLTGPQVAVSIGAFYMKILLLRFCSSDGKGVFFWKGYVHFCILVNKYLPLPKAKTLPFLLCFVGFAGKLARGSRCPGGLLGGI